MKAETDPVLGNWYRRIDNSDEFQVVPMIKLMA